MNFVHRSGREREIMLELEHTYPVHTIHNYCAISITNFQVPGSTQHGTYILAFVAGFKKNQFLIVPRVAWYIYTFVYFWFG